MRTTLPLALVALVGCGAATDDAPADTTDTDVVEPATARWMADVFDGHRDMAIGRVLIPGAFNATSYANAIENGISPDAPAIVAAMWASGDPAVQARVVGWSLAQDLSVREQLQAGARFVEINITVKDGALVIWHSVYGAPFEVVLDDLVDFATAHPSEALVLTFGVDVFVDPPDWPLIATALTAPRAGGVSLCDLLDVDHENSALATLAELESSGRTVVWSVPGELGDFLASSGCPTSHVTVDRRWSITDDTDGVAAALQESVDARDPTHLLINDFVFSLDGADSAIGQAYYTGTYPGAREASAELGFSGDFAGQMIERFDVNQNMNVFAGAFIEDTNLVEAAIAANRRRVGD